MVEAAEAAEPAVAVAATLVSMSPPPPVVVSGATISAEPVTSTGDNPEEENQDASTSRVANEEMLAGGRHSKKNAWTAEEDAMLARIIAEQGHGHWTKVAAYLPGRMGRQCRERWLWVAEDRTRGAHVPPARPARRRLVGLVSRAARRATAIISRRR